MATAENLSLAGWTKQASSPIYDGNYPNSARPAPSDLLISEDFSNFSTSVKPNGFQWSAPNNTLVTAEPSNLSNDVLQFTYTGNPDLSIDAIAEQRMNFGAQYQEIWFKYRCFVPANYVHRVPSGTGNNKGWFNVWKDPYNGYPLTTRIEFWRRSDQLSVITCAYIKNGDSFSTHYDTDSDGRTDIVGIDSNDLGQWIDLVFNARLSDQGATNGRMTYWKNGTLLADYRDLDNSPIDPQFTGYDRSYLLGYANSGFTDDTIFLIDDYNCGTTSNSISFTPVYL